MQNLKPFLLAFTLTAIVSAADSTDHSLPPALLGNAGPPRGETLNYYKNSSGYLAEPQGTGPHGSVVLIHEWNGLTDRIREVADAMAVEGYIALAADLYSGRTGSNPGENMALVRETLADPETLIANLNAAVLYLNNRPDSTGKVGAIGWCYGGGVALNFALGGIQHEATAIFYGRLLDDPEQLKRIDHEVYGTFAGQDRSISVDAVNQFVAALRTAGVPNDVHIYDSVNHGFWLHVDGNPDLRSAPALDAWSRLKRYLARTIEG
jgi:carboxymethylenebutenolidase